MQFQGIFKNWQFLITIIVPIILLPIFFLDEDGTKMIETFHAGLTPDCLNLQKFKCAYVILIMAVYWMTDAIPLPITALMPIALFPLLGVQDTPSVTQSYLKEALMLFVAGLILALAVEYSNLHKRIAIKAMIVVGGSPYRLVLATMLTTMFFSTWISNTATCAMMVPIVLEILEQLNSNKHDNCIEKDEQSGSTMNSVSLKEFAKTSGTVTIAVTDGGEDDDESAMQKYRNGILLGIAYSSNIGSAGSILGSPTNLILIEKAAGIGQNGTYTDLTFVTWMFYNVPPMLVNVFIAWIYLITVFFGFSLRKQSKNSKLMSKENQSNAERLLKQKYSELGPISFHEAAVASLFFLVVLLWFFRDPKFIPGWVSYFPYPNFRIGDATCAMLVVVLLFIVPKNPVDIFRDKKKGKKMEALLDWHYIQTNLPWGIVLLFGGGFAISSAADKSGLSEWLGNCLVGLIHLPLPLILLIVMVMTATVTELASNTACANVIIPILIQLSKSLNIHPLYLTLPATVACSYAFMLPVATPPNAIVHAAGNMKISEMVKSGVALNIICVFVLLVFNITYGSFVFEFGSYKYPNSTLN